MALTDIFVRRPVLSLVVSLLILFIGVKSLTGLPIRQYPKLSNTVATVTTVYPGASPDLIQGFITTPIEQAVSSADGIDYLTSSSVQGASTVTIYLKLNFDPTTALTDILTKVQQVKYQLPAGSQDPVITKKTGDGFAVMYLGFASPTISSPAISDYLTRVVQPILATVEGVASADILGGQIFAMRVWLDPARMAARGISPADVSSALAANNYQAAAGQTKGYYTISNIVANTDTTNVEQFKTLVVKAKNDGVVRLQDIATVELAAQSTDSSVALNGQHAVFIGVNATPTGNPLTLVQGVRRLIPDIERTMPAGLKMDVAYDSTKFIQSSINEVEKTLVEAIGIVVVVIFLFLGSIRSVLIPVVTIPLSLIGAATIMAMLGFSLNLLTLLSMVLAIGLVVDDAIVVVENVYRHIEEGKTPVQSALIGAREIVGPVIAMTITLAAVYAPIGLLGGLTGTLFREFAFTLAGAVIVSGVVALTLSPMMCSVLLRSGDQGWFARRIDRVFSAITRFYGRRLADSLQHRSVTALFAVAVMIGLVFLYKNISPELAPQEDQGILFGITKGPQSANIDYMDSYGKMLDDVFASFPETDLRFIINGTNGANNGFAGMILKPWDERKRSAQLLTPLVQGKLGGIPGVNVFATSPSPLPGGGTGLPIQMVISSTGEFQELYTVMEKVKADARKSGKFLVIDSDLNYNQPVVYIDVDHDKANDMGVTMQAIGNSLSILLGGNYVNRFNLNGRSYEVIPQVPRGLRLTPDQLSEIHVTSASGQQVPLSTLVKIRTGVQPNALSHYNQLNAATFQALPTPVVVTLGEAVDWLKEEAKTLPPGFSVDFLSQSRQYVQEGNQLAITFLFALVIIFLVLAAQFESLRDPLVIMISVPLAISGALLAIYVAAMMQIGGATMNIYSQVGLVTLIGLISKHGILMVEFANEQQIAKKLNRREAIVQAAQVRLRPILMTTAAMVSGLIPLLLATGAGAASRFSIGLVVVSGMSIGTLFTLFVLPMVYTLIATDHQAAAQSDRVKEIAAVAAE